MYLQIEPRLGSNGLGLCVVPKQVTIRKLICTDAGLASIGVEMGKGRALSREAKTGRALRVVILTVPWSSAGALHDQLKAGAGAVRQLSQRWLHRDTQKLVRDKLARNHRIHTRFLSEAQVDRETRTCSYE